MLRFTSLTVDNFGPFKTSQTIEFTDENGVTIIWGNNGRGKTTLLNIFRYALFGSYVDRSGKPVDMKTLSNIEGREEGKYDFKVVLCMQNDGVKYELTRQCILREGVTEPESDNDYNKHVYLKEDGSILGQEERDHVLNTIMPEEVTRFFLFDGELLGEYEELLTEGNDAGQKIKDSIEQILGVPVLTNGVIDIQHVLDGYEKEKNRIASSNKKTEKIASQIDSAKAEQQSHLKEKQGLEQELSKCRSRLSELREEEEQNKNIAALFQKHDALEKEIEENESKKRELFNKIIEITSSVWECMVASRCESVLDDIQKQIKALEGKKTSQEVKQHCLEQMRRAVEERHCELCDQDIDSMHVEALIEKIKTYTSQAEVLTNDEKELLQSLTIRKAALEKIKPKDKIEALEYLEKELANIEVKIDDKKRQKDEILGEIKEYGNANELGDQTRKIGEEIPKMYAKISNYEEGIKKEEDILVSINQNIETLDNNLNKAATDEQMRLATKRTSLCREIKEVFEKGIDTYRDKLKKDVEKDATEFFLAISNDPDYKSLKINSNYGLAIVHQSGEIAPLRSSGYEHIIALSLIGALHKNAPLQGPIIMDSPFSRLDPIHKQNVIKALPTMGEQIILLVYTDEIDRQQTREVLPEPLKEYKLVRRTSFCTEIEAL